MAQGTVVGDALDDDVGLGRVPKWFNGQKGFGFIARGDAADVFVHRRDIDAHGFGELVEGQRVEFEIGSGAKVAGHRRSRPVMAPK